MQYGDKQNINQMQNVQQDGSEQQREQSLLGTVAGSVGHFMAMGYMYMQLDGVFDLLTNSHIKGYRANINLPFSDFYSSVEGGVAESSKFATFSTNMAAAKTEQASLGNIARTLYKSDEKLLGFLKEQGFSDDVINKIKNNGGFNFVGANSPIMDRVVANENKGLALIKKGTEKSIEKGKNLLAKAEGRIVAYLKKRKLGDDDINDIMRVMKNTTNIQHSSSKVSKGVGFVLSADAMPLITKIWPARILGAMASVAFHPLTMMVGIPLAQAVHSILDSPAEKKAEAYKTQEDIYSFSSTEQEFLASDNMNMQTMLQNNQINSLAMQGGRDVDKYIRMAFRKNGNVNSEPQRYRKRYR